MLIHYRRFAKILSGKYEFLLKVLCGRTSEFNRIVSARKFPPAKRGSLSNRARHYRHAGCRFYKSIDWQSVWQNARRAFLLL